MHWSVVAETLRTSHGMTTPMKIGDKFCDRWIERPQKIQTGALSCSMAPMRCHDLICRNIQELSLYTYFRIEAGGVK
jgi:hypothetical protein